LKSWQPLQINVSKFKALQLKPHFFPIVAVSSSGGFVLGDASDRFGRRPTFALSMALLALAGVAASLARGPKFFAFCRVFVGFALAGAEGGAFIMGMELVGPSKRTLAGILCWFFETTGLLATLAAAFLFGHNWRLLQVGHFFPALVATCSVFFRLPPRPPAPSLSCTPASHRNRSGGFCPKRGESYGLIT